MKRDSKEEIFDNVIESRDDSETVYQFSFSKKLAVCFASPPSPKKVRSFRILISARRSKGSQDINQRQNEYDSLVGDSICSSFKKESNLKPGIPNAQGYETEPSKANNAFQVFSIGDLSTRTPMERRPRMLCTKGIEWSRRVVITELLLAHVEFS